MVLRLGHFDDRRARTQQLRHVTRGLARDERAAPGAEHPSPDPMSQPDARPLSAKPYFAEPAGASGAAERTPNSETAGHSAPDNHVDVTA